MADVDIENQEGGEDKPKPRPPRPAKPKGGGGGPNIVTIITAAVAVAAIVVCGLLAWQMMSLKAKLDDAGIQRPGGIGGGEPATEDGENGEGGHAAENPEDTGWEDNPIDFKYEMSKFTAKTADGRAAVITLALKARSGVTFRDMEEFEALEEKYNIELHNYEMMVEEYLEANKVKSLAPGSTVVGGLSRDDLVCAGFILMHGGAAPMEWPEKPEPPEPPKTILEQKIMEAEDEIREVIIDEINARTADELNTQQGRDMFKNRVIDRLNVMFDRYLGVFTGIVISDIITA